MGHASVETTINVYTQVLIGSLRAAAETVGRELFKIDVHGARSGRRTSRICWGNWCARHDSTCDLLVRSGKKGVNTGQREIAALRFSACFSLLGQHQNTASRYALSVICQSMLSWRA